MMRLAGARPYLFAPLSPLSPARRPGSFGEATSVGISQRSALFLRSFPTFVFLTAFRLFPSATPGAYFGDDD